MNCLWTVDKDQMNLYLRDPQDNRKLRVINRDEHFARVLCHLLNNSSSSILEMSDEEMDMRGVPKV